MSGERLLGCLCLRWTTTFLEIIVLTDFSHEPVEMCAGLWVDLGMVILAEIFQVVVAWKLVEERGKNMLHWNVGFLKPFGISCKVIELVSSVVVSRLQRLLNEFLVHVVLKLARVWEIEFTICLAAVVWVWFDILVKLGTPNNSISFKLGAPWLDVPTTASNIQTFSRFIKWKDTKRCVEVPKCRSKIVLNYVRVCFDFQVALRHHRADQLLHVCVLRFSQEFLWKLFSEIVNIIEVCEVFILLSIDLRGCA